MAVKSAKNRTRAPYAKLDAAILAQARDLVAAGFGWAEVERRTGIKEGTLRACAKRHKWLVPRKCADLHPPPPPPPSIAREAVASPTACAPPPPAPVGDVLQYAKDLLFYALKILGSKPCTEGDARVLVRELPPAIRALASVPEKPPVVSDPVEDVKKRIAELSASARPEIDDHSAGDIDPAEKQE